MTIAEPEVAVELELELLFKEKISVPCECDHEKCSRGCKGHHLPLATVEEIQRGGLDSYSRKKPCPRPAQWMISLRGEVQGGYVPPTPQYICDKCKGFWSANDVFDYVLERL